MVCLGSPFKFFKDCFPQILLGPFLNTLTPFSIYSDITGKKFAGRKSRGNCRDWNLATFTTFPSHDNLFFDLSWHLIPRISISESFFLLFFPKRFYFWVLTLQNTCNIPPSTEDFRRFEYAKLLFGMKQNKKWFDQIFIATFWF